MDFARNSNPRWFWFVKLFVIAFDRGTTHKFACKLRMNVQQSTKEFRLKSLKRMSVDECTPLELRIYNSINNRKSVVFRVLFCAAQSQRPNKQNTKKTTTNSIVCERKKKSVIFFFNCFCITLNLNTRKMFRYRLYSAAQIRQHQTTLNYRQS